MAIRYAVATGNWSAPATWNGGTLPTSADDVYSNNFTVTIDTTPIIVSSLSNTATTGVTTGGGFRVTANGISVTCTALLGLVTGTVSFGSVLSFSHLSGTPCSLNANLSSPGNTVTTLSMSGSGTLNYTGNLPTAGSGGNSFVISNGTVNMTGNVTTNSSGNGISISGAATVVYINGTIYGPTGSEGKGVTIGSGTLNITGEIFGGSGVDSYAVRSSGGTTTITGTISGSSVSGALANVGGTVYHIGTAQASATFAAIGPGSAAQVTYLTGPLLSYTVNDASAGVNPCIALRWFPADTALGTFEYRMRGATASGSPSVRPTRQMFLTNAYAAGYPSAADVRKFTTYGPGSIYTGTLAVPIPSAVVAGVPVDNTFGTVFNNAVDVWNVPVSFTKVQEGSLGQRMSNAATIQSVGAQLTALGS